jgi:hypothetical protein
MFQLFDPRARGAMVIPGEAEADCIKSMTHIHRISYWYIRFLQTCLLRGFTVTFIVRIIVQFLVQKLVQKLKKWVCTARAVLVQKLNNNSDSKCKSKSPEKTRLQKSAVINNIFFFNSMRVVMVIR